LLDLERLPGKFTRYIWHPTDAKRWSYIPPEEWDRLPSTLCGSWSWLGEKRVGFVAAWENPDDEYHVGRKFRDLLDEATHVVTYNGNRADLLWIHGDVEQGHMPAPRPYRSVDLFKLNSQFAFERRSLRHLLDRLDLPNKSGHYDPAEAERANDGDAKAQASLKKYNVQDTRVLADLFRRVQHRIKGLNLGLYYADADPDTRRCPACGSTDLKLDDQWAYTSLTAYAMSVCQSCGAASRSKHRKNAVDQRLVT